MIHPETYSCWVCSPLSWEQDPNAIRASKAIWGDFTAPCEASKHVSSVQLKQ